MIDDSREGLSGLDEALCVRHIANSPLITCQRADDFSAVFGRSEYKDFDQLPVCEAERIVGIVERSNPKTLRPLNDSVLVGADTPLARFIHTVHEQPYRLVVEQMSIKAIVTWSDLLKLPVTVLAFALVARLECAMNRRIKEMYGGDDRWLDFLENQDRNKILARVHKLKHENLVLPTLELADLTHKAKILRPSLSRGGNFEVELKSVTALRNEVMHAKEIVRSNADFKKFVEQIDIAEEWLRILHEKYAQPAIAG
jgi:hypothetical protein